MRSVLPGSLRYLHGSRRTWVVDDREISLAVADRTSASSGSASITVTSTGWPAAAVSTGASSGSPGAGKR